MQMNTYYADGKEFPTINVAADNMYWPVRMRFPYIDPDKYQNLVNRAYDLHVEEFWYNAQILATEHFGKDAKVYSTGRGGKHLIVDTSITPTPIQWDTFEKKISALFDYYNSVDLYVKTINRLIEEGDV